ncbi:MAG: VOC family protein [Bacteroidales bacterium]|nr:VOC family protein [Bacteroidales bacterium]
MKALKQYIILNGNCKEVMNFYQTCFGGELNFTTFSQSPIANQLSNSEKNLILHSTLKINDNFVIMASDNDGQNIINQGNNISLFVECSSEDELYKIFSKLSFEGMVVMPLMDQFWDSKLGMLTDKFGINWMLSYEEEKPLN